MTQCATQLPVLGMDWTADALQIAASQNTAPANLPAWSLLAITIKCLGIPSAQLQG